MRLRATIALGGALAAALIVCGAIQGKAIPRLPALASVPADGLARALSRGEISEAEYALERARSLFRPEAVAARYGTITTPDPRGATLVLRDLALRLPSLTPSQQAHALRVLARPDDGVVFGSVPHYGTESQVACSEHACFHWVTSTTDAPLTLDADGDTVPDQVERTQTALETVWSKTVDSYGYRPPKSDLSSSNHGPDEKIDIYLADVGAIGLYGYCSTDDPSISAGYRYGDVSAYCVLDNDFSFAQFPGTATPDQVLAVTIAHEFFHAVQFAYDIFEDRWLMEGTAVWMEDEIFDEVNDNYQYLVESVLARPAIPIDLSVPDFANPFYNFQYGIFIFFRFLSESTGSPDVVRRIWELAQDVPGSEDQYSLQAVDSMLREQGSDLRTAFARFAAANVYPAAFYEEGAAYPRAALARQALRPSTGSQATGEKRLDHLTSFSTLFRPGQSQSTAARLRVEVDLPSPERGSAATLLVVYKAGPVRRLSVPLDQSGKGQRTVRFGRGQISSVVLVLSNGSGRLTCWRFTNLSCMGAPLDDGMLYRYDVRLVPGRG